MPFPNTKSKYKERVYSSAKDYVKHKIEKNAYPKKIDAKTIIICYSDKVMDYVKNHYKIKHIKKFPGDLYLIKGSEIGILGNFGIGAPAVATLMEELVVYGVKNFISIGESGALQSNLEINDIVVCEKSIRDEGTSYHYLKPSKYSYADKDLTKRIKKILKNNNIDFYMGKGWTIDTPYRETVKEIKKYQKEGVLTVDMEASAVFAIAKSLNVKAAAIFVISDILVGGEWKQVYHKTDQQVLKIIDVLLTGFITAPF